MKSIACSFTLAVTLLCTACASTSQPQAQSQTENQAKNIFDSYQSRERLFDPAVADLYCDRALIRNVRTYPNGQQRTLKLPATQYKELIRAAMPLARSRGDYSTWPMCPRAIMFGLQQLATPFSKSIQVPSLCW